MTNSAKRLIFLYSTRDSGHWYAASAVEKAVRAMDNNVQTLDVETLRFISPKLGELAHKAYVGLVRRNNRIYDYLWDNQRVYRGTSRLKMAIQHFNQNKFRELFCRFRPDVAICTQALPCGIISKLKGTTDIPFKIAAVITDYDVHSYWIYDNVDYYMVATSEIKKKLSKRGVSAAKIKVTGIPVSPSFNRKTNKAAAKKKLGIDKELPVVSIMSGSLGLGPVQKVVRCINRIKEKCRILVLAGRNMKVKKKLETLSKKLSKPLTVYGYVDNIDEIMDASDLLITKPGGITVTEALVKNLPMVLHNFIGGQETRNCRFLIKGGAAVEARSIRQLSSVVSDLLGHPEKLNDLSKRAKLFCRPDASSLIANIVLKSI
ncbi:MAG: glycosyltransferase [Candidatus Omnitrophica bacterium]|nr:glycosyltransferase [Candidatus Omnitrophota bacterium]